MTVSALLWLASAAVLLDAMYRARPSSATTDLRQRLCIATSRAQISNGRFEANRNALAMTVMGATLTGDFWPGAECLLRREMS
jgi:hypothetical protein